MTHALRQHCGSFLYDSIRQQWPSEEETSNEVVLPRASVMERSDKQGLSGVPVAWPLFTAPSISSLRVTKFQDKDGIMVRFFSVMIRMPCLLYWHNNIIMQVKMGGVTMEVWGVW